MVIVALYGGAKYGVPDFEDASPAPNKGYQVVYEFTKELVQAGIVKSGNCVHFMDNWYTSTILFKDMMAHFGIKKKNTCC